MGRFRAPSPILLLALSSVVAGAGAVASHPLAAYPVAAQEQVPPDPTTPAVTPTAGPQPSVDDLEAEMLSRLNAERAAAGVGPVQNQPWAQSVARQHSQDMAAAGNIWHNMTGYMDQGHSALGATYLGENVSMDHSLDANDARLFASPGHHANIVDPRFNYVGIGIALDANDWVYVTEDFAAIPHASVAQAARQAAVPAPAPAPAPADPAGTPPDPAPAPAAPAPAPAPPRPAAPAPSPPAPAPPAPILGPPAPASVPPGPAGGPSATAPNLLTALPPAPAFPLADLVQGLTVPAPVEAPAAQLPGDRLRIAAAAPALPTAAPPDSVVSLRSAAPGAPRPPSGWVSQASARARRWLPVAGIALYVGAALFSRATRGPTQPPPTGGSAAVGAGRPPLRFQGLPPRPWIRELPRGPPLLPPNQRLFRRTSSKQFRYPSRRATLQQKKHRKQQR